MFLASNKIHHLNMDESDKDLLLEILKMKLSTASVEQMKLYTDTQKCEAVNRSLSVSLPKNVNFSRNMEGRAHSAIHKLNNDPGTSTIQKCENSGVKLSARVKRSLISMDKEAEYERIYSKKTEVVKHKLVRQSRAIQEHTAFKMNSKVKGDYQKGQLDPVPSTSGTDHNYIKCKTY